MVKVIGRFAFFAIAFASATKGNNLPRSWFKIFLNACLDLMIAICYSVLI
jgi:hypothetical protein